MKWKARAAAYFPRPFPASRCILLACEGPLRTSTISHKHFSQHAASQRAEGASHLSVFEAQGSCVQASATLESSSNPHYRIGELGEVDGCEEDDNGGKQETSTAV